LNRKTSALRSEADIQLILTKGAASDPMRTFMNSRVWKEIAELIVKKEKAPEPRGFSTSELPLRSLVISTLGAGNQQF